MARTEEEKKAAQAAAHKKWRESEKGRAYALKRKLQQAGPSLAEQLSPP
jgi:hypothetical protein